MMSIRDVIMNMPADEMMDAHIWIDVFKGGTVTGKLPPYSTDIKAAWEVFEFLSKNSREILVGYDKEHGWRVSLWWFKGKGGIHELEFIGGGTPALAICRAALLAVKSASPTHDLP